MTLGPPFAGANILKSLKILATLSIVIVSVAFISGVVPANAQDRTAPATNIIVFNGHNPSEVILSWDAVYGATHYRIGCVNMDRDYPRAKATVTGNWQEAFVYVDVEAQNLSPERPSYTLHGLQEGAYHACSVLTNNARYGQPTWPFNPRVAVPDRHGSRRLMPRIRANGGSRYDGAAFHCAGIATGATSAGQPNCHAVRRTHIWGHRVHRSLRRAHGHQPPRGG